MKRLFLLLACVAAATSVPVRARADEDHAATPAGLAAPAAVDAVAADSSVFKSDIIRANKLGMTLTNYGFIGTNFSSRAPSFEYPLGTGFQHMVRGGIWIGGGSYDENGAFTGVSTAAQDGSAGSGSASATEYTPGTNRVFRRSTLPEDQYAAPGAVSEADFISLFSDMPSKFRTGSAEDHRSLRVAVTQYNYAWSFADYANMLFFHYVIRNDGPALHDVWVGLYSEMASGDMKQQSSTSLSAGWFKKKQIGWIDSHRLFTERYCLNKPIPNNCHYDIVPELVGMQLLGVRPGDVNDTTNKKITLASWSYAPGSVARDEDSERYAIMSAGTVAQLSPLPDSLAPYSGDPVELLAVGPFQTIESGDSVTVDFALIGATDGLGAIGSTPVESLLVKRAVVAQRAYDLQYIVPVPPPSPKLRIVPRDHAADYYFNDAPESFLDPTSSPNQRDFEGYRIYAGDNREDLRLVAQFDLSTAPNDTIGFNTGMGAVTLDFNPADGVDSSWVDASGNHYRYRYTLDHLRDGFKYWGAVTSFDVGNSQIESLESGVAQNEAMFVPGPSAAEASGNSVTVFPNPYRVETAWDAGQLARSHFLWFANLPPQCTIKIYTLAGALIYETEFDGGTYDGRNARGIYQPSSDLRSNLSGTMFGWDLITREGQATASGLYLWAVEDKHSGKRQTGKFLLVKSDRENF